MNQIIVSNTDLYNELSKDKQYEVIVYSSSHYYIINDLGIRQAYSRNHFITLDEYRNEIISEILK